MTAENSDPRTVLRIGGTDNSKFLQGLITNDVAKANAGLTYAALLTPQGKYLADFFVSKMGEDLILDVAESLAKSLYQRLSMYKLRSDVTIEETKLNVHRGAGAPDSDAFVDPRTPAMGWRRYSTQQTNDDHVDWNAHRVAHLVPQSGFELVPDQSYILEMNFEALNGVDFRKGCYVGQEVTARMKHKTELRKGLARVGLSKSVPLGTEIQANGKPIGKIHTQSKGRALAYLRFDRAGDAMVADETPVRLL